MGLIFTYLFFSCLLSLSYFLILVFLIKNWESLPVFHRKKSKHHPWITVLVPARNETDHIRNCIQHILAQDYPNFDIIVIDDHSTDDTVDKVNALKDERVQVISLATRTFPKEAQSFKKLGIEIGVKAAKGTWIVMTDADCIMKKQWLSNIANAANHSDDVLIAGPVLYTQDQSLFEQWQSLDFIGMMGVTGAGIHSQSVHLCNGANLAFKKSVFEEINGYQDYHHLASGDDMLLLQKIRAIYPNRIRFLKSKHAATYTYPMRTMVSFWRQRVRWATKTTSYPEKRTTLIWALVWLFCVSIFIAPILSVWFGYWAWIVFLGQFLLKVILDYIFLSKVAHFFERPQLVSFKVYFPAIFFELSYIILVGLAGNLQKKYVWKGRKVQ